MDHEWKLIKWPGRLPRYKCAKCKADVVEENGQLYYYAERTKGPSDDCNLEIIKAIMKL